MNGRIDRPPGPDGAHAALLVLRATLPRNAAVQPGRVRLVPGGGELDDAGAAAALAELRPVECVPEARDGVLVVRHAPLSAEEARFAELSVREFGGGYMTPEGWEALRAAGTRRVLLAGRGERMLLDAEVLEASFRDYAVTVDGLSVDGRPPTPAERELGAAWVVQIGRAEPITAEDLATPEGERSWRRLQSLQERVHRLLEAGGPVSTEQLIELMNTQEDDPPPGG